MLKRFTSNSSTKLLSVRLSTVMHLFPYRMLTICSLAPVVHVTELPFKISQTPDVFTPFRKRVEGLPKLGRDPLPVPEKFKPFPKPSSGPYVGYGDKFDDLTEHEEVTKYLLAPLQVPNAENDKTTPTEDKNSAFPFRGGETSAIERLEWYFNQGENY